MLSKSFTLLLFSFILFNGHAYAQFLSFPDSAEVFLPGIVSTKNSEVKIAFNRAGTKALWGGIDWIEGKKDFDIWESDKINGEWTKPVRASFDSDSTDFDPFFSPDDKTVYFFSNRVGGFGGDDIYQVSYNAQTGKFGEPVNAGPAVNSKGDEWAPVTDPAQEYLYFSTDGRKGYGKHDLFKIKLNDKDAQPINLGNKINSADDDFDAVVLPDGTLVFTSTRADHDKAELFYFNAAYSHEVFTFPTLQVNSKDSWTLGPSISFSDPGYLYFSSHLAKNMGRTDIYRIKYVLKNTGGN